MQGRVGEYLDETPEQLKVRYGAGITGWVAENRAAERLDDAAKDPRAQTIPGTEDDLDESMLLAPMLFEDEVLGVLVLSKLGLRQFRADDLRLLEIYASFAAQAMANANAMSGWEPRRSSAGARPARAPKSPVDPTTLTHCRNDRRPARRAVG
jgi:signal transduction protein with GAF and PtsI domain